MIVPLLLLVCAVRSNSHKILVYNMKFAHSHSNFIGNVADILVDAGHDVVSRVFIFSDLSKRNNVRVIEVIMVSAQTSFIPSAAEKLKDGSTKGKVVRVPPHPDAAASITKLDSG